MENNNSGFIDSNFIHPISNLFIDYLHSIKITPNMITTFTLILRLILIYFLINKIYLDYVPLIYFISWITDAMDGQLARKYNLSSKFGGYYDSFVDILTHVLMWCTLYKYYNKKYTILNVLSIFLIFFILSLKKVKNIKKLKCWEKIIYNESLSNYLNKNKFCYNFLNRCDPGIVYLNIFIFLIIMS